MTGGTPPFMKQSHISKFLAVEDEEEKEEKPSEVLQGVNSVIASEYCPQYLTIIIFWIQQKRIHPVHSSTASGFGLDIVWSYFGEMASIEVCRSAACGKSIWIWAVHGSAPDQKSVD